MQQQILQSTRFNSARPSTGRCSYLLFYYSGEIRSCPFLSNINTIKWKKYWHNLGFKAITATACLLYCGILSGKKLVHCNFSRLTAVSFACTIRADHDKPENPCSLITICTIRYSVRNCSITICININYHPYK